MPLGDKLLGVDVTATHTTQQHELGLFVRDGGKEYRYVKAGGTIGANVAVKIATADVATVSGNAGAVDGVSHVAIASGSYGFIQTRGEVVANVEGSLAAGALCSFVADANGDIRAAVAVNEGGATSHAAGIHSVRGKCTVAESAGLGTVLLY